MKEAIRQVCPKTFCILHVMHLIWFVYFHFTFHVAQLLQPMLDNASELRCDLNRLNRKQKSSDTFSLENEIDKMRNESDDSKSDDIYNDENEHKDDDDNMSSTLQSILPNAEPHLGKNAQQKLLFHDFNEFPHFGMNF